MDPSDADPAHTEAARLRYQLSRLTDRRSVRAALAVGELRRAGPGAAWRAARGRAPRLDVPGPAITPTRPALPQLRAVHTGGGALLASTAIHDEVTPTTGVGTIRRDRPDLVLVDRVVGWSAAELTEVCRAARACRAAVVTVGPHAAEAVPDADLRVATELAVPGAHLELGPVVDTRLWAPVGLDDATHGHRRDDAGALSPDAAHEQPVVTVPVPAEIGRRRCLELLAAGALVVTGPDEMLEGALGADAHLVTGPLETLEARAGALLADTGQRRRVSVRLRRRVHERHSTRRALLQITTALDIAEAPRQRISVLLASRRPERVSAVLADLTAQHHDEVEVILLPHGEGALPDDLGVVDHVERVDASRPLGAVLNVGLAAATGEFVAKVDDDDRYGPNHLGDLLLALRASGAQLVGRRVHGVYLEDEDRTLHPAPGGEERWENHLPGGTLLAPADVLRAVRWRHVPDGVDTELVRAVHLTGGSCYSSHRYGYVRVRHGDHTYDPQVAFTGTAVAGFDASLLDA